MATISPAPPIVQLAERLRLAVARTARRLRQEVHDDVALTLVAALGTVERHGPLTPSELAAREGVQRPTMTRIAMRLQERGLIDRTADPHDGRSSVLAITDEGRALLHTHRTRKDAYLARRLRELSPEDRGTLARATEILEGLLEDGERS